MQPSGVWALKPLADMTTAEFRAWSALIEERTGQVLGERRRVFLQTRLGQRMRELGLEDYQAYLRRVAEGPRGALEWATLLDRLTVQETRFYRHAPSFAVMEGYLSRRLQEDNGRPWMLWSVGCASGEEAYSLAISAAEVQRRAARRTEFGVIATDISQGALNQARDARYDARRLEALDTERRERYLHNDADGWRVTPELAARVCCARLNVLDLDKAPWSGLDVIFCQNLLIYFRRWRRRDILNGLAERLAPGGLLVLGVGEMTGWQHPALQPVADERVLAFTRIRE